MTAVSRSTPTGLLTLDEAKVVGQSLRPVQEGLLKQPAQGRSSWWVSDQRYIEVSVFDDDDGVSLVEVAIRGRLCRYRRGHGTSTSVTDELSLSTPAPASRLESADDHLDRGVVEVAITLLLASPDERLHAAAGLIAGH